MDCKSCGDTNQKGSKFCKTCGYLLGFSCPECKKEINPDSKFCILCGASISREELDSTSQVEPSESVTQHSTTSDVSGPKKSYWSLCGKIMLGFLVVYVVLLVIGIIAGEEESANHVEETILAPPISAETSREARLIRKDYTEVPIDSVILTETYTDEIAGFSIDYDENWKVQQDMRANLPPGNMPDVDFFSPESPHGPPLIKIEIQRVLEHLTVDMLLSEKIGNPTWGTRNFEELSREHLEVEKEVGTQSVVTKIELHDGYLSKGVDRDANNGDQIDILTLINAQWAISVIFVTEPGFSEINQPLFREMIASFKIFEPAKGDYR